LSIFWVRLLFASIRPSIGRYRWPKILCLPWLVLFSYMAAAQVNTAPTFRSETTVVLVPTLVTDEHGDVIFGLTQRDFVIEDNGVERPVHMDDPLAFKPVSMVVAVQTGGDASAMLENGCISQHDADVFARPLPKCHGALHGIGSMLETLLADPKSEMAIVNFDSTVRVRQEFTSDTLKLTRAFDTFPPGDDGSAILDAVQFSLELLKKRPGDRRKVLVVVSEQADRGSTAALDEEARRIVSTDTEVYMIAFPENRKEKVETVAKLFGPLLQQEILRQEVGGYRHGDWGKGGAHGGGEHAAAAQPATSGAPRVGGGGGAGAAGGSHLSQSGSGPGASGASASSGADAQTDNSTGDSTGGTTSLGLSAAGTPGVDPSEPGSSPEGRYGLGPRNVDLGGPLVSLVRWSAAQMHTNVPQAVANLTGGEYVLFSNAHGLDEVLEVLANHVHNRYQLSFTVKEPTPGPHRIQVHVREGSSARIWARAGYWATGSVTSAKANSGSQKGD